MAWLRNRCGAIAPTICWWPKWSSAARRCWTSAAATAICCSCSKAAASREGVNHCVAKGLAVVQGDADTDLVDYPDDAFDYVILSQTLQATRQPKMVLENLLRIGRRAIVSFPNFGFWRLRLQLLIGGHMPRTENLPSTWYDTPNIHFCTIKDFVQLCDEISVKMERAVALDNYGRPLRLNLPWWFWNMFGEQGVFLLSRAGKGR
jgi:methionine biosynthesis protein MetW